MLKSVQGTYRSGRIELAEQPLDVPDEAPVIVTFLEPARIDLRTRGIDETSVAQLRARLARFVEDWDSPEMKIYDNYDAARANL